MSHILEDLRVFLESAPTAWHAAYEIGNRLASLDFIPLSEDEKWHLEPGGKYFVIRNGSFCAFSLPRSGIEKMVILASHTDSPALKLKPNPEIEQDNMVKLGVEVYGGPLLNSWLNRDLGIAGRIIVKNGAGEIEEKLVFLDDAPLFIPQLAIHLDREVNDKGLSLNKQEHLCPIICLKSEEKPVLENLIRRHLTFDTLLSADLFLVPIEAPRFLGINSEMIGAYRIDNLASAHACAHAIASSSKEGSALQMAVFFNHEEVGSGSEEGAQSPFLTDIIKRIAHGLSIREDEIIRLKPLSLCISVDMAHAFNPNYASKYDAQHKVFAGSGVAIKYHAGQKYATNAASASLIVDLCTQLHIPYQSYVARSDMACGSTVGPDLAQKLGIPCVDIGVAQFSMHSAREVMACQDHLSLCHLLTQALER